MATAFDDETNDALRTLARKVMSDRGIKQNKLAELIGVSPSYVSDFLNDNRGAGFAMLTGLGRLAPLEFLGMLDIDPGVVAALHEGKGLEGGDLMHVPDAVRRAARAVIELDGCTPGAAGDAAVALFEEHNRRLDQDADWWFAKIRKRVAESAKSGERPSVRVKTEAESHG